MGHRGVGRPSARQAASRLRTELTYDEANRIETRERNACGSHCEGQAGGSYIGDRVWKVYRIDW